MLNKIKNKIEKTREEYKRRKEEEERKARELVEQEKQRLLKLDEKELLVELIMMLKDIEVQQEEIKDEISGLSTRISLME